MNLDHLAAVTAQSIVAGFSAANSPGRDKVETVIRKALGIVQESGPTAAILFLYTRSKEEEPASKSLQRGRARIQESPDAIAGHDHRALCHICEARGSSRRRSDLPRNQRQRSTAAFAAGPTDLGTDPDLRTFCRQGDALRVRCGIYIGLEQDWPHRSM